MPNSIAPLTQTNPLLSPWNTPHAVPPFAQIQPAHFPDALNSAMTQRLRELDAIAAESNPTFTNTYIAFDRSGQLLAQIEACFQNYCHAATNAEFQAIERDFAAPLAAHHNAVFTHAALFAKLDLLYSQRDKLALDAQSMRLCERVHFDFVRAGAKLSADTKARLTTIIGQLADATTQFSQNVLADENEFFVTLETPADVAGLPDFVLAAAGAAARARGFAHKHVITLSRSLVVPFLTYSTRRDLRAKAFSMWLKRGELHAERNNLDVAAHILKMRLEQAQLHGYTNFADYALADRMAGTPKAVNDLLLNVWQRAVEKSSAEAVALNALGVELGELKPTDELAASDWFYLAEKLRQARYALDDAQLKPYFSLTQMTAAAFDCAKRLFGVTFTAAPHIQGYHSDVQCYEAHDAKGALVAVFMHDNFARQGKSGGAWMSNLRRQRAALSPAETKQIPIVLNNNNFNKAPEGQPTLLSYDDARTLFHEFGHGLHGMLSSVNYERLSGTNVLQDFVELPSQLFEHWLAQPAVLKQHALHATTGEPISDALIAKLAAARQFNVGFDAVTTTSSGLLDMQLHQKTNFDDFNIHTFEAEALKNIGMPAPLFMRHRLPHFSHLFAGDSYAAGYYVYLWAEVLDADAFDAFEEAHDIFSPTVAARLLKNIYSGGATQLPMQAYEAFRGRAPTPTPMLRKKGLLAEVA